MRQRRYFERDGVKVPLRSRRSNERRVAVPVDVGDSAETAKKEFWFVTSFEIAVSP